MYQDVKLCVKHLNSLSDICQCDIGLFQGEMTSPIMFSLFLNDIEMHLQNNLNAGISFEQLSIYLLIFADNAAIVSETKEGLQESLNNLHMYCSRWNLTVNVQKTKIVVF